GATRERVPSGPRPQPLDVYASYALRSKRCAQIAQKSLRKILLPQGSCLRYHDGHTHVPQAVLEQLPWVGQGASGSRPGLELPAQQVSVEISWHSSEILSCQSYTPPHVPRSQVDA